MSTPNTLRLYSTAGCHLCETAKAIIQPLLVEFDYRLQEIDIADSEHLMQAYGIRIPVVVREDTGGELGWPFDDGELRQLLNRG